jgi:hypothetical protein
MRFKPATTLLTALALFAWTGVSAGASPMAPTHAPQAKNAIAAAVSGSWTTYHHDNARTGFDSTQPAATGATTGWVSPTLDGAVYNEPLVYNGLVYVGTLSGTVYALNQSDGTTAWFRNLGAPQTGGWTCGNISADGILGTGVIDAVAQRVYYVTFLHSTLSYWLFGLDLATGTIQVQTEIKPTGFTWQTQQERGALAMSKDGTHVYVPFGGRAGDCTPYHGWVEGVSTDNTIKTLETYMTPSIGEGFWAAGGVVVDDSTGKVIVTTGNAMPKSACSAATESDAIIRLSATLAKEDQFQPADWNPNWCFIDMDLGSASSVLISPTLAFQSGKWGTGFLVNPANLGGVQGEKFPTPKPQTYAEANVCLGNHSDATFGSFAYAAPYVYMECEGHGIVALQVNTSTPSFSLCDATCAAPSWNTGSGSFGPPIVAGGIVWAADINSGGLSGFDAASGTPVFQSGGFAVTHFTTPSEAGGQIFVSSDTVVRSFNMIAGCSSVTLSAAPPTSAPTGTTVMLTAAASGPNCVSPQYQYWMRPAAGAWTMLADYSSSSTYNWTSTTVPGGYFLSVHARALASSAPFESLATIPYTLTSTICTLVSASAAPPSPQPVGTGVTITASGSGCPNPRYQFWLLPPGGTWTISQPYSSSGTFNWTTTGLTAGTWRWSVWVRDAASSNSYDVYYGGTAYVLTTTACTSVTASAAPASPQLAGTPVTITASASGCPNPRYQFWTLAPGGAWTIVQPYSPSATFNWNTSPPAGTYRYSVWFRDASSAAGYDTYFPGTTYVLTTTPCASVTASAAPASPQAHGTPITITASASGCPSPRYQFWILAPGGSWTIKQAYSGTATFNWNTTGLAAGTYHYSVWVRDASSANSYDTYFPGTAYVLT